MRHNLAQFYPEGAEKNFPAKIQTAICLSLTKQGSIPKGVYSWRKRGSSYIFHKILTFAI